jgi:hypothetical protein
MDLAGIEPASLDRLSSGSYARIRPFSALDGSAKIGVLRSVQSVTTLGSPTRTPRRVQLHVSVSHQALCGADVRARRLTLDSEPRFARGRGQKVTTASGASTDAMKRAIEASESQELLSFSAAWNYPHDLRGQRASSARSCFLLYPVDTMSGPCEWRRDGSGSELRGGKRGKFGSPIRRRATLTVIPPPYGPRKELSNRANEACFQQC